MYGWKLNFLSFWPFAYFHVRTVSFREGISWKVAGMSWLRIYALGDISGGYFNPAVPWFRVEVGEVVGGMVVVVVEKTVGLLKFH